MSLIADDKAVGSAKIHRTERKALVRKLGAEHAAAVFLQRPDGTGKVAFAVQRQPEQTAHGGTHRFGRIGIGTVVRKHQGVKTERKCTAENRAEIGRILYAVEQDKTACGKRGVGKLRLIRLF